MSSFDLSVEGVFKISSIYFFVDMRCCNCYIKRDFSITLIKYAELSFSNILYIFYNKRCLVKADVFA